MSSEAFSFGFCCPPHAHASCAQQLRRVGGTPAEGAAGNSVLGVRATGLWVMRVRGSSQLWPGEAGLPWTAAGGRARAASAWQASNGPRWPRDPLTASTGQLHWTAWSSEARGPSLPPGHSPSCSRHPPFHQAPTRCRKPGLSSSVPRAISMILLFHTGRN